MSKIMITGANGQLGTELRHLLDEKGIAYDAFDSHEMDITDKATVDAHFNTEQPEIVFHCAAFTAVDPAEDEKKDLNWAVNETGTKNVAEAAQQAGAILVYISTDYVFDGTNEDEYQVDAPTTPKNEYGKAKNSWLSRLWISITSFGPPGSLANTGRTLSTRCSG